MTLLVRISNRIDNKIINNTNEITVAQNQLTQNYLEGFKWGACDKIYLFTKLNNDLTFIKGMVDTGKEGLITYLNTLLKNLMGQIMRSEPGGNLTLDSHGIARRLDEQAVRILYEFVDDLLIILTE